MRGVELDSEDRALLDRNITEAEAAYKAAGDFETQARALSGWREARPRLDAVRAPDADRNAVAGDLRRWRPRPGRERPFR